MVLRFWTVPPTQKAQYTVTFQTDSLGIGLCPGTHDSTQCAMVDRVAGAAKESGLIAVGHILLQVNGQDTAGMDFEQIMQVSDRSKLQISLIRFRLFSF